MDRGRIDDLTTIATKIESWGNFGRAITDIEARRTLEKQMPASAGLMHPRNHTKGFSLVSGGNL
jgi:hypothetical protein